MLYIKGSLYRSTDAREAWKQTRTNLETMTTGTKGNVKMETMKQNIFQNTSP